MTPLEAKVREIIVMYKCCKCGESYNRSTEAEATTSILALIEGEVRALREQSDKYEYRIQLMGETLRLVEFECGSGVVQKCRDKAIRSSGEANG